MDQSSRIDKLRQQILDDIQNQNVSNFGIYNPSKKEVPFSQANYAESNALRRIRSDGYVPPSKANAYYYTPPVVEPSFNYVSKSPTTMFIQFPTSYGLPITLYFKTHLSLFYDSVDVFNFAYTLESLSPNTLYDFYFESASTKLVSSYYSIHTLSDIQITSPIICHTQDLQISYSGTFKYFNIYLQTPFSTPSTFQLYDTIESPNIGTFSITGLTANTLYDISLVSYDDSDNIGVQVGRTSVYTLPSIQIESIRSMTPTTFSVALASPSAYSSIHVYARNVSAPASTYESAQITGSGLSFQIIGLSPNTTYDISLIPYNDAPQSGTAIEMQNLTTLPQLNGFSLYANTTTDISLQILNDGSFSSLDVYFGSVGYSKISLSSPVPSIYTFSNLSSNTPYQFYILPFNSIGISGTATRSQTIWTKPFLRSIQETVITNSSIAFQLSDGSFSYVYGFYQQVGSGGSYTLMNNGNGIASANYTLTGLLSNTSYNVYFIPYNGSNVAGTATTTYTVETLPTLNTTSIIIDPSVNYMTINGWNDGSYNTLTIQNTTTGNIYTWNRNSGNRGVYVDNTNILPNRTYSYVMIPYNTSGISGTDIFRGSQTSLPLAISGQYSTVDVSTNAFTVMNISGSYSYVKLVNQTTSVVSSPIFTTSYRDTVNIQPNQSYTCVLVPYNTANRAGNPFVLGTVITLPKMTYASFSVIPVDLSTNAVRIVGIQGFYDTLIVRNLVTNITSAPIHYSPTPQRYTDASNILPNTSYQYIITPYNSNGASGEIYSVPNYQCTLPLMASAAFSDASSTQITIRNIDGSYNYYVIQNTITGWSDTKYFPYTTVQDTYHITPDTSYSYTITPYNYLDVSGAVFVVSQGFVRTLATISSGRFSTLASDNSTNAVSLVGIDGSYTRFVLQNNTTGRQFSYTYPTITITDTSGILPNVVYSYTIIPYNKDGISGVGYAVPGTKCTLPQIISGAFATESSANAVILSGIDGSYSYYELYNRRTNIRSTYSFPTSRVVDTSNIRPDVSYSYTITPYNVSGISGAVYSLAGYRYTLPSILSAQFTAVDSSTVHIDVSNTPHTYQYFQVKESLTGYSSANIFDTSYTVSSTAFRPTDIYTFYIIPYNDVQVSGQPWIQTISPTANITNVSVSSVATTSLTLSIQGGFSSFDISNNVGDVSRNVVGNTFAYSGLSPNRLYSFTLTPYNTSGIMGSRYITTPGFYTLPTVAIVGSTYTSGVNDISFVLSGNYDSVRVYNRLTAAAGGGGGGTSSFQTSYTTVTAPNTIAKITGLLSSATYDFSFVPLNPVGGMGTSVGFMNAYTVPKLTSYSTSVLSAITFSIVFDGCYNSVDISYSYGTAGTAAVGNTTTTSNNITITNRGYEDTSYNIRLIPNNGTLSGQAVYLPQICTFPTIYTNSYSVTTNSISLDVSGAFSYYTVAINGTLQSGVQRGTTYSKTGLSPDTSYNVILIPYNYSDISGNQSYIVPQICTYPTISVLSPILHYTTNSITLDNITGAFAYYTVKTVDTKSSTVLSIDVSNVSTFTKTGLMADTSYSVTVIPYNYSDVSGNQSVTLPEICTYPTLNIPSVAYTTTNATISNISGAFQYYTISTNGGPSSRGASSSYIVNSLSADTSYTFFLVPYNYSGVSGNTGVSLPIRTLPEITGITYIADTNQITIQFTGSYSSFQIFNSTKDVNENGSGSSYVSSDLSSNMYYTYFITPKNLNGDVGQQISTSFYTLPRLTYQGMYQSGVNDISLSFIGDYSYVQVFRKLHSSNTYDSNPIPIQSPNTSVDITGLLANQSYDISLVPWNRGGASGAAVGISNLWTFPTISSASIQHSSDITDVSNLYLAYDGSFDHVNIRTSVGGKIQDGVVGKQTNFDISGLSPDTSYNISLIAYNGDSTGTYTTTLPPIATYPSITAAPITQYDTSSITINNIQGSFLKYSVMKNGVIVDTSNVVPNYVLPNLLPNVSYSIQLVPLNHSGISGSPLAFTKYTLPTLTAPTISYIDSSTVIWSNIVGAYNNYTVNYGVSGSSITTTVLNNTNTTYKASGLSANTYYNFSLVPYNSSSVSGNTIQLQPICTLSKFTDGYTFTITTQNIFTNSVNITGIIGAGNGPVGIFDHYDVYNNGVYVDTSTNNTYTLNGLTPDTSYNIKLISYNQANVQGASGSFPEICTWPYIPNTTAITGVAKSAGVITYTVPDGSYNYFVVSDGCNNAVPYRKNATYDVSNLAADTSYSFLVVPYNYSGISGVGTGVMTDVVCTLPYINPTAVVPLATSATSIRYTVSDGSYNYFVVSDGFNNAVYYQKNATYDVTNLATDTSYSFTVVPYNYSGISGAVIQTAACTWGTIGGASITADSSSSLTISITSGSYLKYGIYYTISGGTTYKNSGINTTSITGLQSNTAYNVRLYPYNYSLVSGDYYQCQTTYTLSYINNILTTNRPLTGINVSFTSTDGGAVDISWALTTTPNTIIDSSQNITSPYTITNLTDGKGYSIYLWARNAQNYRNMFSTTATYSTKIIQTTVTTNAPITGYNNYYKFISTENFTLNNSITANFLLVGGGGGGGCEYGSYIGGGGGGAGTVMVGSNITFPAGNYTITIGNGGSGGIGKGGLNGNGIGAYTLANGDTNGQSTNGKSSILLGKDQFGNIITYYDASGGGFGGNLNGDYHYANNSVKNGGNGGSGGGSVNSTQYGIPITLNNSSSNPQILNNRGGSGNLTNSGGGGGATSNGSDNTTTSNGNTGGNGVNGGNGYKWIDGKYYGGGGGAGGYRNSTNGGSGGTGGGGSGGWDDSSHYYGVDGINNTGGGGGGAGGSWSNAVPNGGNGGSGVFILAWN